MNSRSLFSTLLAFAAGGVGGYFLGLRQSAGGRVGAGDNAAGALVGSEQTATSAAPANGQPDPAIPPADYSVMVPRGENLAQTMRAVLNIDDPVLRLRTIQEWARGLSPSELPGVMKELETYFKAQEDLDQTAVIGFAVQILDSLGLAFSEGDAEAKLGGLADQLKHPPEGGGGESQNEVLKAAFAKWATRDPAAAKAFFDTRLSSLQDHDSLLKECGEPLVRGGVKTDPEGTLRWIHSLPEALRDSLTNSAFQTLSHSDPAKASELLVSGPDLPNRDRVAGEMAAWWAKREPKKALDWALGLPPAIGGAAVTASLSALALNDFPAALARLETLPEASRAAGLQGLVQEWPADKLSDAGTLVGAQSESAAKSAACADLVKKWAVKDVTGASGWLAAQPPGAARDAGAVTLAEASRAGDPEAAAVWLTTVSDSRLRHDQLETTIDEWYRQSPPAAVKWLETAPELPAADRETLLKRFRPGG